MSSSGCTDKYQHLLAVRYDGGALYHMPQHYKGDREIVLAAVQDCGSALEYAAEECKADSAI
eukprot:2818853-Amphidinium_carterae.1